MRSSRRPVYPFVVSSTVALVVYIYGCVGDDPNAGRDPVFVVPSGTATTPAPPAGTSTNPPVGPVGDGDGGVTDEDAGPCVPDLGCQLTNPCKTGRVDCSTGRRVCVETGSVANGAPCSATSICRGGVCEDPAWALWPMPTWAEAGAGPVPSYVLETGPSETFRDTVTGLVWVEGEHPPAVTWAEANKFCQDLVRFGHADWRLPTVIELVSIGDPTTASGFASRFDTANRYWSSTPGTTGPGSHFTVGELKVVITPDATLVDARCVR